ncbi:urea active transporter [Glarea lozoyensis ATCC 20868]|uniref:Urea active transporter n=1 Tax=Glarea lozoyensis (strain ATCC 20868 / MF5171) TaxID=1116229 RepID=S3DH34_GLAL2|nr:urea active transporter [Glarea lozoyensis ATCC 20868]EPE36459.1 urea active transporter [Glarea lozoyensis ATCC 20868]
MLKRLVLGFAAAKHLQKPIRRVATIQPNIRTRAFHEGLAFRSACDFGRPCDCSECSNVRRKPICEVCHILPTAHQSSIYTWDRKGVPGYNLRSYCEDCWTKYQTRLHEDEQKAALKRAARVKELDEMMERVKLIRGKERVPVRYAVNRFIEGFRSWNTQQLSPLSESSRAWYQGAFLRSLSQELQIDKVRNKYLCNKERVDAMDFEVWFRAKWER